MRLIRRRTFCSLLATSFVAASGCALFEEGSGALFRTSAKPDSDKNLLPPIVTPRDALKIEIVLVERPLGDRLVGPALWQEIDQVGALPADTRELLREVGIRVGNAGSSPSPTLEKLLEMKSQFDDSSEDNKMLVGRSRVLLPGAEDLITTNHFEKCSMDVPGRSGVTEKEYENANSVFRVRLYKVQDGWARLEFQPELHSGQSVMRAIATKTGFGSTFSQEVDPFPDRRFSVNLHVGEMAVITSDGDNPRSIGSRCFLVGNDDDRVMQRVLIVRLANMAKTDPVYSK